MSERDDVPDLDALLDDILPKARLVVFDMHDLGEPEYGEVWVRSGSSMRRHARFEGDVLRRAVERRVRRPAGYPVRDLFQHRGRAIPADTWEHATGWATHLHPTVVDPSDIDLLLAARQDAAERARTVFTGPNSQAMYDDFQQRLRECDTATDVAAIDLDSIVERHRARGSQEPDPG